VNCPNRAGARGLCPSCERDYDQRRGSSTERGYNSPEWRALVAQVKLEEPFCRWPGCDQPTEEVDHRLPKSQGGTDDRSNLQGLCRPHHSQKTMRESVARR
jgi:5-methylcytosine-specific restriction enzyme A